MLQYLLRVMKFSGAIFMVFLIILLFQCNTFVLHLADSVSPGTGWIAFLVVTAIELCGFVWLFLAWSPKSAKLILRPNPTQAEIDAFAQEMQKRLRKNTLVRKAKINPNDPQFTKKALEILDARADAIIREDASKIFLGTAIAQNGRLDALIVFIALARMVFRVSNVYNQRPTPSEIWSVYSTVASSSFIAFSIDALNIPQTVTNTLGAILPAVTPTMATASVPFVGSAMNCFTTATLEGAANSLIAVRAGIITRNSFRYTTLDEQVSQTVSAREIRDMMLDISKDCVTNIADGLRLQVKSMTEGFADTCVEKGKGAAQGVINAVKNAGDTVKSAGDTVSQAASTVGKVVTDTASSAARAAGKAVTDTASSAVNTVSHAAESAASAVTSSAKVVGQAVTDTASSAARAAGKAVTDTASSAVNTVSHAASAVTSSAKAVGQAMTDTASSAARAAGKAVTDTASSAVNTVSHAAESAASAVTSSAKAVLSKLPFSRKS